MQLRALFVAWLLLSSHVVTLQAFRQAKVKVDVGGDTLASKTAAHCPTGLDQSLDKAGLETCAWRGPLSLQEADPRAVLGDIFLSSTPSELPISWGKDDGVFRLTEQFMSEFSKAVNDKQFQEHMLRCGVLDLLGNEKMSAELGQNTENRTMKESLKDIVGKGARVWKEVGLPANLLRAVIMPTAIVDGLGTASGVLGVTLAAGWIPVIGWTLTGVVIVGQLLAMSFHFQQEDQTARETTEALVMRARCVRSHMVLTPSMAEEQYASGQLFSKELTGTCSSHAQAQLLTVIQRANFALRTLLGAVEEYGRCLYPAPWNIYGTNKRETVSWLKRRTRKSSCFAIVNDRLVQLDGKPGLLTLTLSLIASYGKSADSLLQKPLYGDWMERKFGTPPGNSFFDETMLQTIRKQVLQSDPSQDDVQAQVATCMLLTASHRAYEMTFKRLTSAWKIYAQSYMRDTLHVSARNIPYPCKAFYDMQKGANAPGSLCKNHQNVFVDKNGKHVTGGAWETQTRRRIDMDNEHEVCEFAIDFEAYTHKVHLRDSMESLDDWLDSPPKALVQAHQSPPVQSVDEWLESPLEGGSSGKHESAHRKSTLGNYNPNSAAQSPGSFAVASLGLSALLFASM